MANANSLTIGNTTLPVANTLASLDDTNITSTPADGSLLTLQNGKWTPNTVEGAIGGKPAYARGLANSVLYGDSNGDTAVFLNGTANGISRRVYVRDDFLNVGVSADGNNWSWVTYKSESDTGWQYYASAYFDFMYRKKNGIVSIVCNGQIKQNVSTDLQLNAVMPEGYRPDTSYIPAIFSIRSSKQAICVFFGQDGTIWAELNGTQAGQTIVGSASYFAA